MKKYLLALALLVLACGCKKPMAFEFRGIKNVQLQQSALDNSALSATLTFFNPNNYVVQIKNISSDVYINNDFITHYDLDTLIKVPGNSLFDFNASVNFATAKILKNVLSSFFSKEATIRIVGKSKVGRSGFFVNVPFDVNSKQKLNF
ncbi:MAG: hypothetical protein PW786_13895 [Arachidicoccus sp.]|nr:hypothetical protein [Arachidicoccus sp.]